jgi:hypothetical protein
MPESAVFLWASFIGIYALKDDLKVPYHNNILR